MQILAPGFFSTRNQCMCYTYTYYVFPSTALLTTAI